MMRWLLQTGYERRRTTVSNITGIGAGESYIANKPQLDSYRTLILLVPRGDIESVFNNTMEDERRGMQWNG